MDIKIQKHDTFRGKKDVMHLIFSFLAIRGIVMFLETTISIKTNFSNMLLFTVLFYFIYLAYKNRVDISATLQKFVIIFSFFLTMIIVIGLQLEINSNIDWSFNTIKQVFLLLFFFYPFLRNIIYYVDNYRIKERPICKKKLFLKTFFIILFFDFMVFLAAFPGVYGYDAGFQVMQFFDKGVPITSHFSLIYSGLLSAIISLGKTLFNSYEAGFAIYSFLQMSFLTFVASKIVLYVYNHTKNWIVYIICVMFFSFFPLYTIMIISSAQDVFFSGILALIFIDLLEMVRDNNYLSNKKTIKLFFLFLMLCLFRNNGFHITIFSFPIIVILSKNKKLKLSLIFLGTIAIYLLYTGPIFNLLVIQKSNSIREILSIPSQQLARVYNYNNQIFSKYELKLLNNFYDTKDFNYYTYRESISDPIKGVLNIENTNKNLSTYIKLWFNIGLKDPKNYVEAFLLNNLGVWYPDKNYIDDRMYHPYIEYKMLDAKLWNEKYIEIKRNSKFPLYEKILNKIVFKNSWKNTVVVSTIFKIGSYFVIFVFLIGLIVVNKRYQLFIPLSIFIGLYITVFLAPVALFRYCFSVVIILPILLQLIFDNKSY